MRDLALFEIGISGGNIRFSFQVITLRYVSWGFSEQNGGYPANYEVSVREVEIRWIVRIPCKLTC